MKVVKGSARVSGWLMSFLLIGCGLAATTAQAADRPKDAVKKSAPAKAAPTKVAPVVVEPAEPATPAIDGLQGRDVYQILLGEIALKRGEAGIAAEAYADVARRTGDDALFGRAVQVAVAAQHYDTALQLSQNWVQAVPDSAAARHALVNVLAGLGRGAEMTPHLERLLALDVEARPRNLLHLPRLFAGVDPELALATLQTLVEPYQDLAEAQFALASAARAAGRKAEALTAIREAYRLRPGWPAAGFLEAQLQDSAAESIEVWTRVLKDNKDSEPAYLQRARLYVAEKKYNEARADFEAALALNPASVDTLYALGILTLQLDDRPAAENYFRQLEGREFAGKGLVDYQLGLLALERGDLAAAQRFFGAVGPGEHYVSARAQLALMLSRQGKLDEARKLLAETEATTVGDRSRLAIADSHVLREAKQLEAAFAVLEAALVAAPNEPDLLYDKAMLADQLKKPEVVEMTLTRLIELRPNHPHAYNALGYSWAERNIRLEEARQLILRALELAPHDPFILDSMGWVMFRLGQPTVALMHLEDAYRQRPDPEIAAHMGEVLWSLGRRDEARKLWAEARLRYPDNEVLGAVIEKFQP
jgi:tetratricopeptide (TPR) repeat protein